MKKPAYETFLQKCHELVVAVYQASSSFPEEDAGVMTEELRDTVLNLERQVERAIRREPTGRGVPAPIDVAQGKLSRLSCSLNFGREIKYLDAKTLKDLNERVEDIQGEIDRFIGPRAVRARKRRWGRWLKIDAKIAAEIEAEKGG